MSIYIYSISIVSSISIYTQHSHLRWHVRGRDVSPPCDGVKVGSRRHEARVLDVQQHQAAGRESVSGEVVHLDDARLVAGGPAGVGDGGAEDVQIKDGGEGEART